MIYGNSGGGFGLYIERIETHVLALPVCDGKVLLGVPTTGKNKGVRTGIGGLVGRRRKENAVTYHCHRILSISPGLNDMRFAGRKDYQLHTGHKLRRVEVFVVDGLGVELEIGPGFVDPVWYPFDQLPLSEMAPEDRTFLPRLLHSSQPLHHSYVFEEDTLKKGMVYASLKSVNYFDSA